MLSYEHNMCKTKSFLKRRIPLINIYFPNIEASGLSEERRECRFRKDSHDLKLFSQYSQAACQFECQINMAANKCGCTPWDYPQMSNDGLFSVCEGWGRYCFISVLEDTSKRLKHCGNCLPDCITTRYIVQRILQL